MHITQCLHEKYLQAKSTLTEMLKEPSHIALTTDSHLETCCHPSVYNYPLLLYIYYIIHTHRHTIKVQIFAYVHYVT